MQLSIYFITFTLRTVWSAEECLPWCCRSRPGQHRLCLVLSVQSQQLKWCLVCSVSTGLADANAQFAFGGPVAQTNGRRQLYGGVLSRLRLLMISRMAKPEEVGP